MEKQVTFHIKIESDGAEVIHKVTAEAGELAKVINDVTEAQTELNSQMINQNQFVESWKNFYDGFQEAEAIMSDLSDAYNTQMMAEVKLDTIMKQRMDATDGMVESIKNLCSEQQKIGVIGDEVQLSGAQQMATFLNEKQSLDKLIPAMNNLLAQQKGLNATNQDDVSIGNMMGKAMQGQVEVLQRVGITFDEAQKQENSEI